MRIIGCLSWYDESAPWLAGAVASIAPFCDHLVAVDGAYALFPNGRARSASVQHDTLREATAGADLGLTIHVPRRVWEGNEVEKRTRLLELALLERDTEDDWLFVFDGDDIVLHVPADLRERLADPDTVVAEVRCVERHDLARWPDAMRHAEIPHEWGCPRRMFFRALDGLRVIGTHWTYVAGEGDTFRCLWGTPDLDPAEPLRLDDMVVEHRTHQRGKVRRREALAYYQLRDQLGIEKLGSVYVEGLDGQPALVR